jgi:hypothetical protein
MRTVERERDASKQLKRTGKREEREREERERRKGRNVQGQWR